MDIPIASFNFQVNFLGVYFVDTSENLPTSWSWLFGDGGSSTDRNPNHTYTTPGSYTITFVASNAAGDDTYTFILDVTDQPAYGYTISQIIQEERPPLLVAEPVFEDQRKKYWMLHLQTLIEPKIADAFVFDETKWPNMVSILIAKLVIHDLLIKLAKEAVVTSISQSGEANTNTITILQDGNTYSVVSNNITLTAPSGDSYQWKKDGVIIAGATNRNYTAIIAGTYICTVTTATVPVDDDPIILTFTDTTIATSSGSGALKSLETGPSKAEWYDVSGTVASLFKPTGSKNLSVFDELVSDVCMTASRLRIRLPMCAALAQNTIVPRKVGRPEPIYIKTILKKYGWTE